MDQIHIHNIRAYGYTGYLPEEQTLGQWFSADVLLSFDLSKAGASDHLEDTVDYRAVIQIVKDTIENSKFALVERLATVICQRLLAESGIQQVKLCLTKEAPPIPGFGGAITLELTRSVGFTPEKLLKSH